MNTKFALAVAAAATIIASSAAFAQTSTMGARVNGYTGTPAHMTNNGGPSASQNAGAERTGGAQGGPADVTGSVDNSGAGMSVDRTGRFRR